jgi:hypothetical protein
MPELNVREGEQKDEAERLRRRSSAKAAEINTPGARKRKS